MEVGDEDVGALEKCASGRREADSGPGRGGDDDLLPDEKVVAADLPRDGGSGERVVRSCAGLSG